MSELVMGDSDVPVASIEVPGKTLWSFRSMFDSACPFCRIMRERQGAVIVSEWCEAVAFEPLDPVIDGHVLVVPRWHVEDAVVMPELTGVVMMRAAEFARSVGDVNIIASVGVAATQTVGHFHVHVVPRCEGDGLKLPWS